MNRSTIFLLGSLAAALLAASAPACGGTAGDILFGTGGGGGAFATTTAATGAGTTTTTSTSSTTATASSTTSTVASSSSTTTTTTTTSVSSSSGAVPPVACDSTECAAGQVCCFNPTGPGDHCGTKGQCDTGYIELSCSDPLDCPGQVCCAHIDPNMQQDPYLGIACQATCADPTSQIVICSDAQPNVCPSGTTCQMSSILGPLYRICH